ncbi:MAG: hypothetical protein WAM60_10440 [Candidatus Promineifilaceae bacterium]
MQQDLNAKLQVNKGRLWPWLALLVGLSLGVVLGFWLKPADLGSATPWEMSQVYQERYLDAVSREYADNGDIEYVYWAIEGWDMNKLTSLLADMEANTNGEVEAQRLATLREDLGISSTEPSFWQLLKNQPMIVLLGLTAGVFLLVAGVLGMFVANEEERVRQAVEKAVLAQAQARVGIVNAPATLPTRPGVEYQEAEGPPTADNTAPNGVETEARSARAAREEAQETQPGQAPNAAQQQGQQQPAQNGNGTGTQPNQAPAAQAEAGTRPNQAQPQQNGQQPQQNGQQPQQNGQQPGQPPTPQPQDPAQPPANEEAQNSPLGNIEDLVAELFDDNEEMLHQQALLVGLGPVDTDELVRMLFQVRESLHSSERRQPESVGTESVN